MPNILSPKLLCWAYAVEHEREIFHIWLQQFRLYSSNPNHLWITAVKNLWGRVFFPITDLWSRISSTFGIGAGSKKHSLWMGVGAAQSCPGGCSLRPVQPCAHTERQLCRHSPSCRFPRAWGIPSQEKQFSFDFFELLEQLAHGC